LIGKLPNVVKYEPDKIPFVQPSKDRLYIPDFKVGKNLYIEAKGKLDLATRQKMVWFRESNPDIIIIFLFQNPSNKITKRSKTTYGDWAEANNFYWLDFRSNWFAGYLNIIKELNNEDFKLQKE